MQTKDILLVEDDEEVRNLLIRMLRRLGYTATAASSAEEALVHLDTQPYPVLLADVVLPGMSGTALAQRVHASSPETRIILTTGQGYLLSDSLPFEFILVPKPFHVRHIEAALADLPAPAARGDQSSSATALEGRAQSPGLAGSGSR